ncbi:MULTISPECIES: hypothetical protein [unclassified Methanosarcina]|nr:MULTISPECIES: hypothetical protein [unclassified Methanosarcina]
MGESLTVLKLAENIIKLPGSSSQIIPAASRAGDVRDLGADLKNCRLVER